MCNKVLVVGLTCLDIVNYVAQYPSEDSDSRVFKQIWTPGGNATNNVIVLGQLGANATLFSALPANAQIITSLLKKAGIECSLCVFREKGELPVSTVIVNEANGSRTIMHYRGQLEEVSCKELQAAFPHLSTYSWIHFEGRNFDNLVPMISYVRKERNGGKCPRISIECEKIRQFATVEDALKLADVVFVSKDFAREKGFENKEVAVDGMQRLHGAAHAIVICPWAEKGVAARETLNARMVSVDACNTEEPVVDTLGAGDCFIACCIHFLNEGYEIEDCLKRACRITGKKVRKRGLLRLDIS